MSDEGNADEDADLLDAVERIDVNEVFEGTDLEDMGGPDESVAEALGGRLGEIIGRELGTWAGGLIGVWFEERLRGNGDEGDADDGSDGTGESEDENDDEDGEDGDQSDDEDGGDE